MPRRSLLLLCLTLLVCGPAAGQANDSVPIRSTLGSFSWRVTTGVPEAQAYFDQGMRLMYAFARDDARRSFAEARRRDPRCAMCWWGEAWAMGPYLNGAMDDADAPAAHAAAMRARSLTARGATPVEKRVIGALAVRYAPGAARKSLDSVYVNALAAAHAQDPGDAQVATLYADALMLLEPRRGIWPLTRPSVARIHQLLEGVLARDVTHPGACHLYIHATETTPSVGRAQRCADLLSGSIPGVSHINHMPSHTYNRVGRWGDATRANLEAWRSDQRAATGETFAVYPSHNLHMLLFSASVDGQSAIAIQAARDFAKMTAPDGVSLHALALVRFGRFEEVLELTRAPAHPVHHGLWAFARGHAHLRLGRPDSAAAYATRVDSLARHAPASQMLRVHTPARLLSVVGGILRAEMLRVAGRTDEALGAFRAAARLEDALTYDEPEPLPFAVRDWLGSLLLEAGRPAEAESVFREALERRPHNGWSLLGLEKALRAQGRTADADGAGAELRRAFSRSDAWLPWPRF